MSLPRRVAAIVTAAVVAAGVAAGVAVPAEAASEAPAKAAAQAAEAAQISARPTGPLAAELSAALHQRPGGVQVSDNAIAWNDGDVVLVMPSPGEKASPMGLGDNVRLDVLHAMGAEHIADPAAYGPDSLSTADLEVGINGSASSCPGGPFSRDWYCFYTDRNYEGVRYQFFSTCSAAASSWGFNNMTSSWVNRSGTNKSISTYDGAGSGFLWRMGEGTSSSYVGSSDDNKMSSWVCVPV